jgi:energy-coupling factor transporter transmembrane protein EcfT
MPKTPYHQPSQSLASVVRKRGVRQVAFGTGVFIVGLLITVFTYHSASSSSSGGTYFVAWGPMVIGVIAIIRGLIAIARASRLN